MSRFIFFIFCLSLSMHVSSLHASDNTKANLLGARVVGIDGKLHAIGSGFDAKPVAILFLNTDCPISRKYTPTLNKLSTLAEQNDIAFFGVFSDPNIKVGEVKKFREEYELRFPVLFDASGDLSNRLNPSVTPEAFVVSRDDAIAYRGRIDNWFVSIGKKRTNITSHDLHDAIIAVGNQQTPKSAYEEPVGCIAPKWEKSNLETLNVTYTRDIAPILHANCLECHREGEVAPFPLETYEHAKRWAPMISYVTQERIMPPWKPVHGYGEFRDERVLSERQIELLKEWSENGAVKGEDADLLPMPTFEDAKWPLGKPDAVVKVKEAFQVPAEGEDIYRYFVVPSNFKEDHPTIGVDFRPGDPTVVHHALVLMDYSGQAMKLDKEDPEPGFSVFGPGNFMNQNTSAVYLAGYAPGMKPFGLPKGTAMWIEKGGDVLLQVHYHVTGKATEDQSEVAFYFQDEYPEQWIQGIAIGTQQIVIPPNESNYERHFYMNVPSGFHILDIAPHMHYLGSKAYAQVTFPDGKVEPLIKIDDWDLSWQNRYTYRKPFYIPAGSRIDAWYSFDNTVDNPSNPYATPQTIRWGLRSQDEMAQLFLVITPDDYYSRPALDRTSRLSWFRDASDMEENNDANPFHKMNVQKAVQLLKDKSQYLAEDNVVINQAIDSMQYEAIVEAFMQYTKENKKDIDAHITYGYLLFTKAVFSIEPKEIFKLYKNSQKSFKRALKLDKTHWRGRMSIANLYKHAPGEMKLTDDAVEILEEVIADQEAQPVREEYATAYKDLSYAYEQLAEYENAMKARNRGAKLFPNDPYFHDAIDSVNVALSE